MIVVDSTVWIALLRKEVTPTVDRLRAIVDQELIVVGDLVLLEVLQGARDESDAERIERRLRTFRIVPMLGSRMAVLAARNYRRLRAQGVTIRKSADMIIGTYCIEHGHTLLHDDRDFLPMRDHLGLQIL